MIAKFAEFHLGSAHRERLDPNLDACAAVCKEQLGGGAADPESGFSSRGPGPGPQGLPPVQVGWAL